MLAAEDGRRIELLGACAQLIKLQFGMTAEQRGKEAREIAEAINSAPPGADRWEYARGMLARLDAGTTSYEDRIILDGCRVPVLREVLELERLGRQAQR